MPSHRRQVRAARVSRLKALPFQLNRFVAGGEGAADRDLPVAREIVQGFVARGERNAKADALSVFGNQQAPRACDLRDQVRIARAQHYGNAALEESLDLNADRKWVLGAFHTSFLHQTGRACADFP